jgi:DNA gyrase/topoisomerase IV subunit B
MSNQTSQVEVDGDTVIHEIAILHRSSHWADDSDSYDYVCRHLSEFVEVTDKDFKILLEYCNYQNDYLVVERVPKTDVREFIARSQEFVKKRRAEILKAQREAEARRKAAEQARKAKEEAKRLKNAVSTKERLRREAAELGLTLVPAPDNPNP